MHGHRIGYVRVSSFDQNPERQLEHVPVDRLFTDKASGKDTQRPELERLLAFVREGDAVVVKLEDKAGEGVADTEVRLITDPAGYPAAAQGQARVTGVPPGRIIVRVKTPTDSIEQRGVAVSNEELRLSLRMP